MDCYQLPFVKPIFNDMEEPRDSIMMDLRSGHNQMALREADHSKKAFWGAQRIFWEWCVIPFGLKNAPPYFNFMPNRQGFCESAFRQMVH